MTKNTFLSDIQKIRERARKHIERGALTEGYKGDAAQVVAILNEALATEIVCILRYKNHYFLASGIHSESVANEFLEHAKEEESHADALSRRIVQLGGRPNWSPVDLETRSHAEYVEGVSLQQMIKENLVAERIAIDTYRDMIHYVGDLDPTTRRILEDILAQEEEHADDMSSLLGDFDLKKK